METTILRTSAVVLSVVGLVLTPWLGIGGTASASTPSSPKAARDCPLTNEEKRPSGFGGVYDWALDHYPGTLYVAPTKPLEVGTLNPYFGNQPIGTLTVATKRGPKTVVRFCANRDGSMRVSFPSDVVTGTATIKMTSREKWWRPDGPPRKDVFTKAFRVVVLETAPAAPLSPTDIRAEVRGDGVLFSWTPASDEPYLEHYAFPCSNPILDISEDPQVLVPLRNFAYDGSYRLDIAAINISGWSTIQTLWHYDSAQATISRIA